MVSAASIRHGDATSEFKMKSVYDKLENSSNRNKCSSRESLKSSYLSEDFEKIEDTSELFIENKTPLRCSFNWPSMDEQSSSQADLTPIADSSTTVDFMGEMSPFGTPAPTNRFNMSNFNRLCSNHHHIKLTKAGYQTSTNHVDVISSEKERVDAMSWFKNPFNWRNLLNPTVKTDAVISSPEKYSNRQSSSLMNRTSLNTPESSRPIIEENHSQFTQSAARKNIFTVNSNYQPESSDEEEEEEEEEQSDDNDEFKPYKQDTVLYNSMSVSIGISCLGIIMCAWILEWSPIVDQHLA